MENSRRRNALSIVVCSRNDNHGGNLLYRFQCFLDMLQTYWQSYKWDMELVVAEWNPPSDKPLLGEVLRWKEGFPIRFVVVPVEVHASIYPEYDNPMWEYLAKNVGLRRAEGDWILCTNPDILFSQAVAELLCGPFESGNYYRALRIDVEETLPETTLQEQLGFCFEHIGQVHSRQGDIFTNGAGDFTLMHRDDWHKLQGYFEVPVTTSLDGLLLYRARDIGISEVIIPAAIYHLKHEQGYDLAWKDYQYWIGHLDKIKDNPTWGLAQVDLPQYQRL